jgi:hypothetical protein
MSRANRNVQILSDTESIRRYTTTDTTGSSVDHSAALKTMIAELISTGRRKKAYIPFGDWYFNADDIAIEPEAGQTSIRNFEFFGDGGNNTQPGTRLYFNSSNVNSVGLRISSAFHIQFRNMVMRCTNPIKAIVHVTADDSPSFSGTTIDFERVHFAPLGSTSPTEASVKVDNVKLIDFWKCWFTAGSTTNFTALRMGGTIADFPSTLQQGVVHNATLRQCFIFGRVAPRNVKQFDIIGNTFGESEYAIIEPDGDKRWQAGSVESNGFIGDSEQTAITLGDYDPATSTSEAAGQLVIKKNEFRDRKVAINSGAKGRATIERNEFFVRRLGDKGIVVQSTARDVVIGPNNFDLAYRNGCVAVDDQRLTTSKMTNIDLTMLAAKHLTSNVVNATTNFERVINCNALNFRGGLADIDCKVSLLNGSTGTQRARVKIQQVLHDGTVVNLPLASSATLAASADISLSCSGRVYLTPDTTDGDADCALAVWVQWETTADGTVRGAVDSNTIGHTYLQAKEV